MKKTIIAAGILASLTIAAPASADNDLARDAAAKACHAEKRADPAAFEATYGPENAMRNCIKATLPEARNAAQECRAERAPDPDAFRATYGTNDNGSNAMGRCVSQKVKADDEGEESA